MGEVPVLVHGTQDLTQSGVILDYLAEQTRKFGPKSDDERREILRWMLFDNHKLTSYTATLRFSSISPRRGETPVTEFLSARVNAALKMRARPASWRAATSSSASAPTIADFSMCGYLFYGDELTVSTRRLHEHRQMARPDQGTAGLETPL